MEYKDYYQILGVNKSSDEKDVKRAYRRLARQYHPDKNPGNRVAEEKLKEINEAYEVLGSPEKRTRYDQLGRNYHRFQQMGGSPSDFDFSQWFGSGAGTHANINLGDLFGASRGGSGSGGFSDFFQAIFGGGFGQQTGPSQAGFGRQQPAHSLDIEQKVELTLEEAFSGTTRTIGRSSARFTAKIPRGAATGTRIRLKGKGHAGPSGTGDMYLVVQVKPHPTFKTDGHNLRLKIEIDVLTAVLGGTVSVPTLNGSVNLTIPPGTQGGQTIRLNGKGLPHLRDKNRVGDLLATVKIRIPKDLSEEQQALYQKLADLPH